MMGGPVCDAGSDRGGERRAQASARARPYLLMLLSSIQDRIRSMLLHCSALHFFGAVALHAAQYCIIHINTRTTRLGCMFTQLLASTAYCLSCCYHTLS